MNAIFRTVTVSQVGLLPIKLFFPRKYLLLSVRVRNRIELSNYYSETILRDYEFGVAGYVVSNFDNSSINSPENRILPVPVDIVNSLPVGFLVNYIITYIEFD